MGGWKALAGTLVGLLAVTLSADRSHAQSNPQEEKLGKLSFATSCDPKVQAAFERGVAMIHSYWFLIARRTFEGVPRGPDLCDCALGHRN